MKRAKNILYICLLTSFTAFSQTNHTIFTSGMSWSPSDITISLGDTVTWINALGNGWHNVNGSKTTFPNNPEGFENSGGVEWTFEHVFTISGNYDFQCDPHASMGMTGTISVLNSTSTQEYSSINSSTLFPNPFQNEISIKDCEGTKLVMYNLTGKLEITEFINNNNYTITPKELPKGIYLYEVVKDNKKYLTGKIVKN